MTPRSGRSIRARVRAEITDEIKAVARQHLAAEGANLSLRAVARELGMVSSALYRYFANRDDLLTALIIDAYNAVGTVAEAADREHPDRADHTGRWMAVARAVRGWALERPAEYALIYGSPVPGYRAPQDTTGPAGRTALVLAGIVVDAAAAGRLTPSADPPLPAALGEEAGRISALVGGGITGEAAAATLFAWTELMGTISFELFGHYQGVVELRDAWFDHHARTLAARVGLDRLSP